MEIPSYYLQSLWILSEISISTRRFPAKIWKQPYRISTNKNLDNIRRQLFRAAQDSGLAHPQVFLANRRDTALKPAVEKYASDICDTHCKMANRLREHWSVVENVPVIIWTRKGKLATCPHLSSLLPVSQPSHISSLSHSLSAHQNINPSKATSSYQLLTITLITLPLHHMTLTSVHQMTPNIYLKCSQFHQ